MKLLLAGILLLITVISVFAATAVWTGRSKSVQTVTYKWVVSCEYNYNGHKFWKTFENYPCPSSIEVY